MNTRLKKQKGFTLIEILIVVVIIGVLAALIMPRMLAQPEKAVVAEANQMLGAITRAQNTFVDSGAGAAWLDTSVAGNWARIGMTAPAATRFTYACTAASCTATRVAGSGAYAGDIITITNAGAWTCNGGAGTPYAAATNGGCTV